MNDGELNLLHRYLDGAITPEELPSLENLLRESEEARAMLRSLATIDAKWQQLAAEEAFGQAQSAMVTRSVSEEPEATVAAEEHSSLTRRVTSNAGGSVESRRGVPFWLALSAIAASLIVGAFGWFHGADETPTKTIRGIARVIRIDGDHEDLNAGNELFAGQQLTLGEGLIELAFRETGVHMIATAPLRMRLDSDQRVLLHEGQVKLVVPPQGVGFVVDTAQRKFVDLGTSFVVTADAKGSEVLVLDGQISVDDHDGTSEDLMHEGEFARFDRDGKIEKRTPTRLSQALPELTLASTQVQNTSLRGVIVGYDASASISMEGPNQDVIARNLLPLIQSGFMDLSHLEAMKHGDAFSFRGIAGAFHEFPERTGLAPYSKDGGWMAWYHGQVIPPGAGRYRFWGYADNHLLLAINGKPVFEGSRKNSSFKELGIERTDNPALPCLIAPAGFACSEWIELGNDPVRLDILFGEVSGNITSGLLLVEREGDTYEETFWGQPKWPLFLAEAPNADETAEFERLITHLEQKTMGSFSIAEEAIWKAQN